MLMQWLGSETRGGAALRAVCAMVAVWLMLFSWSELMTRFLLSDSSTRYMNYVKARTKGTGWYDTIAELPTYATGMLVGLAVGLLLALIFRQRPARVAAATSVLLLALLVFTYFTGGVVETTTQLRFLLLGLVMAAGLFVAPWLMQRWRGRGQRLGA
ncbi:hypothetical protein [Tahibacter harae]|uniref:Uncharacterized protein n=1 Tax=Tahibacter harae TaxID=2963937 RepID=A0ABT1QSS8_9GAMM|nr:hypothetical protein [Tahibacter harae]MCQ4165352.1 hypothetical protein [Tahibacter harae]